MEEEGGGGETVESELKDQGQEASCENFVCHFVFMPKLHIGEARLSHG